MPRAERPKTPFDDLEAFLRGWVEEKRQRDAWSYPEEVERQIAAADTGATLLGFAVFYGDGTCTNQRNAEPVFRHRIRPHQRHATSAAPKRRVDGKTKERIGATMKPASE